MNASLLRLLDANANRAREALRVLEDYARFVLNHDEWCGQLKALRHDLTGAIEPFLANAILHRDTPGDVGTDHKTPSEQSRNDMAHVVIAAGKRLGEALRTIEEFLKTADPPAAGKVEGIRYRFYDLEHQIAFSLHQSGRFASVRLYVLITESCCKRPWLESAELAILGGADCLQLREKTLEGRELLNRAQQLVALCRKHKVLSIINDRPDIALLSDADGVHVGQGDLPAKQVRKLLGRQMIVGVSTHELAHAQQAVLDGADYIGVGPFFKSPTKPREFLAGPEYARQVAAQIPIPAVAIAGICEANVDEVLATGIARIAVTSAITGSDDPREFTRRLKARLAGQKSL
jgi:thiamine-phosphate pyrophosphorylase